ncbi:hypothetical protein RPALISO_142 [Ruegeria phage RpAliso]|nr:hypothetical protein RPALISO_142 [Ruegeria phage RpAliso]
MIEIMLNDGTTVVYLTRVDHFSKAEDAAKALWADVNEKARMHGGRAVLIEPDPRAAPSWSVQWVDGPKQWEQSYVVADGADAREFVAEPFHETSAVTFTDLD